MDNDGFVTLWVLKTTKKKDIFSMIFGVNTVYMRYELFLKSNYSILQLKKNLRVV